ncbi:MAG: COX15/CtaA family protein [Anaerolineaceae bacterium]|nr:COX15/CtaA family protein [Anaerolineaceae bacterium]
MSEQDNQKIIRWLFVVSGLIMIMVVFGGFVRLTRSGLSVVEWNPISGILPPSARLPGKQNLLNTCKPPKACTSTTT